MYTSETADLYTSGLATTYRCWVSQSTTYTTGAAESHALDVRNALQTNVLQGLAALALGARLHAVRHTDLGVLGVSTGILDLEL